MTETFAADPASLYARSAYHYELPESLIAQHPAETRDASRLMLVDAARDIREDHIFRELPELLHEGDLLVVNDSKVIPARLLGTKQGMQRPVEVLLLKRLDECRWETLVRPGRRLREGARVTFIEDRLEATIERVLPDGNRIVRFDYDGIWEEVLDEAGTMPVPPYIHEQLQDPSRYNTVYAVHDGSAAAPTAGLHFTEALFDRLAAKGVERVAVTLHVGLGTFRPVDEADIREHPMHSEYYEIDEATANAVNRAKREGRRVISVGTTSCRVLEAQGRPDGFVNPGRGETSIFIYPGYGFRVIDSLITNFHLPESTLLMLVSALAGRERILEAYREAVRQRYRFFSFGDAMLIHGEPSAYKGRHLGRDYHHTV